MFRQLWGEREIAGGECHGLLLGLEQRKQIGCCRRGVNTTREVRWEMCDRTDIYTTPSQIKYNILPSHLPLYEPHCNDLFTTTKPILLLIKSLSFSLIPTGLL